MLSGAEGEGEAWLYVLSDIVHVFPTLFSGVWDHYGLWQVRSYSRGQRETHVSGPNSHQVNLKLVSTY